MLSAAPFQTGCAGTDQTGGRVLRALAGLEFNEPPNEILSTSRKRLLGCAG